MQNRLVRYTLFALIALAAFGAGLWINLSRQGNTSPSQVSPASPAVPVSPAEALYGLTLPDLQNQPQQLGQWRGKVLVINFWATWCAPCREEIPLFVKMQEKYKGKNLQFVGISIDQMDKTIEFSRSFGINYPSLVGAFDAVEVSRKAGNTKGVLPFTVFLDRNGRIVATESGGIKHDKLEAIVGALLQ